MSNDDGDYGREDRGWFDEWQEDPLVWEYENPEAPEGWQEWEKSDVEGSHWQWTETVYSAEEAYDRANEIVDHPSEAIDGKVGDIAQVEVYFDVETGEYYIEVDAYVEY